MKIEVYTNSGCMPCKMTKNRLTELGLEFEEIELDGYRKMLRDMELMTAPAVIIKDDEGNVINYWAGFRPDKIKKLHSTL